MFKKYEVDVADALKECIASEQFKRRLGSGRYAYVEKRFCLNHPKYIDWSNTVVSLTPYAREHEDECCLQFATVVIGGWADLYDEGPHYSLSSFGEGEFISFIVPQPTTTQTSYCDKPELTHKHILEYAETARAVMALASKLPNNFPKMLDTPIKETRYEVSIYRHRNVLIHRPCQMRRVQVRRSPGF